MSKREPFVVRALLPGKDPYESPENSYLATPFLLPEYDTQPGPTICHIKTLSDKLINRLTEIPLVQKYLLRNFPISGYYRTIEPLNLNHVKNYFYLHMGHNESYYNIKLGTICIAIPIEMLRKSPNTLKIDNKNRAEFSNS